MIVLGSCALLVGNRVVVTSEGSPPEAEYALFEEGEIELQATSPGSIREVAYRSNVALARQRLEIAGVTQELAEEIAAVLSQPVREQYARGFIARRAAMYLGAAEVFDGGSYDPITRRYGGTWLDLDTLAQRLELPGAAVAMQTLHLAALLAESEDDTPIVLSTSEVMRDRRAGERTYRRIDLTSAGELAMALRRLDAEAAGAVREEGPTRAALLDSVRARMALAPTAETQSRLMLVERALTMREQPARGPLADPELWELEVRLTMGDSIGVVAQAEVIERERGRQPATAYLRARAALLEQSEDPRAIAERVSALAQSMSTFGELELLAAQAWVAAGDLRQALAFARNLANDSNAHEDLRTRAADLADDAAAGRRPRLTVYPQSHKPTRGESILARASRPSRRPSDLDPRSERPSPPTSRSAPPVQVEHLRPFDIGESAPNTRSEPVTALVGPSSQAPTQAMPSQAVTLERPPVGAPPPHPPDTLREGALEHLAAALAAHAPHDSPYPSPHDAPTPSTSFRAAAPALLAREELLARGEAMPTTRASSSPPRPSSSPPRPSAPPTRPSLLPSPPDSGLEFESDQLTPRVGIDPLPLGIAATSSPLRGASQPPFVTLHSIPPRPKGLSSLPPGTAGPRERAVELVERLTLPPGLHGQDPPADMKPTTPAEARLTFTFLARDLAREYRERYSYEMRTDVASIAFMQRELLDRFPDGEIAPESVDDVRRHGAFLSEMLARTLGAYWHDIAPSETGYWAMIVPPATRVLPFGRVYRFVALAKKERDLVSYYAELQRRCKERSP